LKIKLEPSVQERILRAFLDIVILRMLVQQQMTAYEIDNAILKKFGGKRSPNVIYTKLASLERENLVKCSKSKFGRVYSITEDGKRLAKDTPNLVIEIQSLIPLILETAA